MPLAAAFALTLTATGLASQPAPARPAPDFAVRFDHKGCHYEYLDTFKGTYSQDAVLDAVPITLTEQERQTLFDAIQSADFFNQPSDQGVGKDASSNYELEVRNAGKRHTVRWTKESFQYRADVGRPLRNLLTAINGVLNQQSTVQSLPGRGDGCFYGPPAIR